MGAVARFLALLAAPLAAAGLLRDGVYAIQNVRSGRYMNVLGGSTAPGAKVVTWGNPGSQHSQWRLQELAPGVYSLQNVHSGTYLRAKGRSKGAPLQATDNASTPAAKWTLLEVANGDGTAYVIKGVESGLFANVKAGSTKNGATIWLWDNAGSTHTMWEFIGLNCHDAVAGEACFTDTTWAKGYAIFQRPDWYPGLTNSSTFADFQAHLHYCYWNRCPLPCTLSAEFSCEMPGRFWDNATCKDAAPGEKCYAEVEWARTEGVKLYQKTWYPELNENSTFGQFQARLFQGQQTGIEEHGCQQPCCHDARPGEMCHEDAFWAMAYGINLPGINKVYPSMLTNTSAFAEFQAYLHLCYPARCPKPCAFSALMAKKDSIELSCPDMPHNYV